MSLVLQHFNRNVIPRWRDFASTLELGELDSPAVPRRVDPLELDLRTLENDWINGGTLSFAADLVSVAILSGTSQVAREAASFILEHQGETLPTHPLTRLAESILTTGGAKEARPRLVTLYSKEEMRIFIASHKKSLATFPRDGILWVDLSLLYTMQGQLDKAKRAMTVALSLQPQSRFVLRSAARLFIHIDEPDRAQQLLRRSPMAKRDPWIMAAEIATATNTQQKPLSVDAARAVLAGTRFSAHDTTELSAAIATLEFQDGNNRKAKKHVRSGLEMPNENSLAQAKWLTRQMNALRPETREVSVQDFNVERSFEASMWEAYLKKQWNTAISNGLCWMRDQPFSSKPAQISAHLTSSLLEDWATTEALAEFGLIANPHDPVLHILLAFAYGSTDQTELARKHLGLIKGPLEKNIEVAYPANEGLIAFREGKYDLGRELYRKAIEKAQVFEDEPLEAAALSYLAREEIHAKTDQAHAAFRAAEDAVYRLGNSSVEAPVILERLKKRLERK